MKRDDLVALIGTRVAAQVHHTTGGSYIVEGTLRAVTPKDVVLIARDEDRGHETAYPLGLVSTVVDARHTCAECGDRVNVVQAEQRCTSCSRKHAATLPPPREVCDCGTVGAFYSPKAKRFACAQCHAKGGTLTGNGVEARVLASLPESECKGGDTEDDRHRWVQIKGHRYHCKFCPARRFTDPKVGTLYADE